MSAAEQAPFHTLVKMVECELELVKQGRIDELQDAVAKTGAFIATLPQPAPESAQALALRAEAMRGRVLIEVERFGEKLSVSRAALRRSRQITRTYSSPAAGQVSTSA